MSLSVLRQAAPYLRLHQGKRFVVHLPDDWLLPEHHQGLQMILEDLVLLAGLDIGLIVVHGAEAQINQGLAEADISTRFYRRQRISSHEAMPIIIEKSAALSFFLQALLSANLHSAIDGKHQRLRVVSGNFVTAQPLGVLDGLDLGLTGKVRQVDIVALSQALAQGNLVLLSNLAVALTGEIFNVNSESVARAVAEALLADKLLYFLPPMADPTLLPRQATLSQWQELLPQLPEVFQDSGQEACLALAGGVPRVHLLPAQDLALLQELFTREGSGTLLSTDAFEKLRPASIDDLPGIIALIRPLEEQGILVRRSREQLERDIDHFVVLERDAWTIGCAALYAYPSVGMAELACLVIHPDYQKQRKALILLKFLEQKSQAQGCPQLFILTTQSQHWFIERGFQARSVQALPLEKQRLYNWRRNSQVFVKVLV